MHRILLVEDSPDFQLMTQAALSSSYDLTIASCASEALDAAKDQKFDVIILDIQLPDSDGFKLCAQLKQGGHAGTPVIFLTGQGDISDKVMGFSLGAEDYILKPFHPLELKLRVDARIPKQREAPKPADDARGSQILQRGAFRVDPWTQKAFVVADGKQEELDLTSTEFKLLNYFMRHEGEVVSRAELLEAIWPGNVNVLDRTIDKHLSSLRKKLSGGGTVIQAVRGEGYRFSTR